MAEENPSPTQAEIDASRLAGLGRDPVTQTEEQIPPGFVDPKNNDKDKLQAKPQTRAMAADDKEKAPYRTRAAAQPEKI